MLEISGFSHICVAGNGEDVLSLLHRGIQDNISDIDLIVLGSRLEDISARELRAVMNKFDEWQLIPIISLTQKLHWEHSRALTDLGLGVTTLFYHPLTAESFPPSVMTELAAKRERNQTY
jgi:DNA-binding response OmpR family regulator